MRHSSRLRRAVVAVAAVALVGTLASFAAAAKAPTLTKAALSRLSGTITADGSSTVGPYTTAAAELFRRAGAGKVDITVGISGTGGGFERFCRGEIDLSDASRPMRNREASVCKDNNVGSWRAFTVANDALTVVVSRENTWATCLTVAELKKIWEPGSKVSNWRDVRSTFPNERLELFGPGTDSGTFEYFTEAINGRARASRSDYSASEDDNVLVQGVAGTKGGLGYFGFSYYEENQSRLKALQVENPKTGKCVTPSVATAQSNAYKPLSRPLFVYAKGSSFRRPAVQAFLAYIFANEKAIATRAGFVPLTTAQLARARVNFDLAVKAANRV
ncbi:MAG TPA: PstS family phosphate ABC transporter substrate-binding protein [Gaiella sp.]|uniref:PstS family phosphate ABC transporter substrate-binding protein n=1 Tax=Gaiella sp. TaxID=2663207 RepID=UPI002D800FF2|nr:PstS family phosphate ABC transporter substrate-binding protein [Gaiella sp.]HET9287019.1 PstS family phosphate ABC transporter substrate-binding protein [Gaiella sp.]